MRKTTLWTRAAFVFSAGVTGWASASGEATLSVRLQPNPPTALDVAVVAHENDWQLFMGDVLARRLRGGHRMVFVYLTTGDDGHDSTYWKTRERAALQSTKVAAGQSLRSTENCEVVHARGHPIRRCDVGNTKSYFLRLPDGRRNGRGFAADRYQSLRKLRTGDLSALEAVDGSTGYESWNDLTATVQALAAPDSGRVVLHTTDPSVVRNPHDHFDHRMAGLLVADLRRTTKWNVVYYLGYALASRAANRSGEEVRMKTELFMAYDRAMVSANPTWSAFREHPAFYSACLQRTYAKSYSARGPIAQKAAR